MFLFKGKNMAGNHYSQWNQWCQIRLVSLFQSAMAIQATLHHQMPQVPGTPTLWPSKFSADLQGSPGLRGASGDRGGGAGGWPRGASARCGPYSPSRCLQDAGHLPFGNLFIALNFCRSSHKGINIRLIQNNTEVSPTQKKKKRERNVPPTHLEKRYEWFLIFFPTNPFFLCFFYKR